MALTNDVTYAMRGKTFVLTGRLENYTRDQATLEIVRRGGKVEGKIQRYTDILICGDKPGARKTNAAAANYVTMRDEQWLMAAFLRNTPGFVPRQRTGTQLAPDRESPRRPANSTAARDYIRDRDRGRSYIGEIDFSQVEVRTLRELSVSGYNAPSESAQRPAVKALVKIVRKTRQVRID